MVMGSSSKQNALVNTVRQVGTNHHDLGTPGSCWNPIGHSRRVKNICEELLDIQRKVENRASTRTLLFPSNLLEKLKDIDACLAAKDAGLKNGAYLCSCRQKICRQIFAHWQCTGSEA